MTYAIQVKNVTKEFKKNILPSWVSKQKPFKAVKNVTFNVRKGEVFGLLGHNGSGKSTLIRMIATLLLPDAGNISVYGVDVVKDPHAIKEMINRVSVEASFLKSLSPKENLMYAARLYDVPREKAMRKCLAILEELEFPKANLDEPIEKCSRGMQQKVAIARGFLSSPMVLVLDEPTTGLDPVSKEQVMNFIKKIRTETNLTVVLTTHDMKEVEQLCDRVAIMKDGKIVALDTVDALKAKLMGEEYILKTNNKEKTSKMLGKRNIVHTLNGNNEILFNVEDIEEILYKLIPKFEKQNILVTLIQKKQPTMEEVFVKLTKGKK
jgi:ABC-2 type transport system ATP-binding protein